MVEQFPRDPFLVSGMIFMFYQVTKPSSEELLLENSWCVEICIFNGVEFFPNTVNEIMFSTSGCSEFITFLDKGSVRIPGFNSRSIWAEYYFDDDLLIIKNADTLAHVFNGTYSVDFDIYYLKLESDHTILHGIEVRSF